MEKIQKKLQLQLVTKSLQEFLMIKLEFKKVEIIAKLLIDAIEKVNIKLGV